MHRSRLTMLVIVAALAACSTRDDSESVDPLAQDQTLVARLGNDGDARPAPLPAACGTITVGSTPTSASQTQAKQLTLQAQSEEMKGNIAEARTMLQRATSLDGTNKSAAYHLGRTNEVLGDRAAAKTAYCRYVALTPSSSESAEARQRLDDLSKTVTQVSAGSVVEPAKRRMPPSVVATRRATRATRTPMRRASASRVAERSDAGSVAPSSSESVVQASATPSVAVTPDPAPSVEPTSPAPRAGRRGPSRTQGAIVGGAAGAIIGAAAGRSVKGAVIGAAAGGILGTIVGGRGGR